MEKAQYFKLSSDAQPSIPESPYGICILHYKDWTVRSSITSVFPSLVSCYPSAVFIFIYLTSILYIGYRSWQLR